MVLSASTGLDLGALDRAVDQALRARRTGERSWQVSSYSRPGQWHDLYVHLDGSVDCTCRAGSNGRSCKHASLVRVLHSSGAVPSPAQATMAPARPQAPWRFPDEIPPSGHSEREWQDLPF